MDNETILNNLKEILSARGISQRDFATMIGKSETVVSRWFSGKVSMSQNSISSIEKALGEPIVKSSVKRKVALISGITGQDGSFFAAFL